jgi:hypothetical protein
MPDLTPQIIIERVNKRKGDFSMRFKEFATTNAQMELWKMVSDAVWSAINKQNQQQDQSLVRPPLDPAAVARAQDAKVAVKPAAVIPKTKTKPKKKSAPKKLPKVPIPPRLPPKPLKPLGKPKHPVGGDLAAKQPIPPVSQRQQPSQIPQRPVMPPQSPIRKL